MRVLQEDHIIKTEEIKTYAVFHEEEGKEYRFYLKKEWDSDKDNITFLMLNPSKADELKSDNTVNNATNFAVDKGFGSITIVNLFADMGTDKKILAKRSNNTDKINDQYIKLALQESKEFVIAWQRSIYKKRKRAIMKILKKESPKLRSFVEYKIEKESKVIMKIKVNHLRIYRKNWKYESWYPMNNQQKIVVGNKYIIQFY